MSEQDIRKEWLIEKKNDSEEMESKWDHKEVIVLKTDGNESVLDTNTTEKGTQNHAAGEGDGRLAGWKRSQWLAVGDSYSFLWINIFLIMCN